MASIWIFHPAHPLDGGPATGAAQPRAAGRRARRGGFAFVASVIVGGWIVQNLSQVEWMSSHGWQFVTDLVAPTVALTVVAVGPRRTPAGRLATSDRVSAGAAVIVVLGGTAATWLRLGLVAALTPFLVGCTALLVMWDGLAERRDRARVVGGNR